MPDINGFLRPVLLGTALAGTLDAIDGVVFNGIANGLNPIQVLQYIASGFFGERSFQMGLTSAAVGLVSHYFIAAVLAAIYVAAAKVMPAINRHMLVLGCAFGVAVFLTVNFHRNGTPVLRRIGTPALSMIGAGAAGREAGLGSNDHGCPRPDPRAGVKAREATRFSGLGLDAEHGSGRRRPKFL